VHKQNFSFPLLHKILNTGVAANKVNPYIYFSNDHTMERYTYPHTIESGSGEQITFVRKVADPGGDYLEVENLVQPDAGPPMHVHFKQNESLTVIKGKLGI
jgi:hypothetical protein